MSAPVLVDSGNPSIQQLRAAFDRMHALSRSEAAPSYEERVRRLDALARVVRAHQDEVAEAISRDFGHRSRHETLMAEVFVVLANIEHTRKKLKRWMRPRRSPVSWVFQPGSAEVRPQPLGVVGVVAPWNYPFQLALAPVVGALAAGNRVLVKPSEVSPLTSALLEKIVAEAFSPDVVSVATGGPDVAEAFCRLPFDHLLFTGSTRLGRLVMQAAAENLTPVTLELGGKSPVIVHDAYSLEKAAERVAVGKCLNAGQTCIAPDYVLVPAGKEEAFAEALRKAIARSYPTLAQNPDYTAIVNDRHYQRLQGWLADAEQKGARLVPLNPANETLDPAARKLAPTLVLGATDEMLVLQEELFGPILPLVPYRTLDEAIAYVNARPRPLALYYFDDDKARVRHVLERTVSGNVTVNDTIFHIAQEELPFGGVGPSGMGAYHGKIGFDTFSHRKGVFHQSRLNGMGLMNPPYGKRIERLLAFLIGK